MSLVTPEFVPRFPYEDISDTTANLLEVMLSDTASLEQTHALAEAINLSFKFGHMAVGYAAANMNLWMDKHLSMMQGVATYETIASYVRPVVSVYDKGRIMLQAAHLAQEAHSDYFIRSTIFDMRDEFASIQPRTLEVVKSLAFYYETPLAADYVVTGAAMARHFDKEALDSFSV